MPTGVYVLSSISKTLCNLPTGFFSMYRGIYIKLKTTLSILCKNCSFSNKTCSGLTALFLKMKIYFCCCNFVNKQITKIPSIVFLYRLQSICRAQNISENIGSFGNGLQIYGHLLKMLLSDMTN